MHPIEKKLYTDHYRIQRLLVCLQKQIDCYEIDDLEHAELPLVLDALDYIRVYPEKWHHPIEDKIFEFLLSKNPPEAEIIQNILQEHVALENLTHEVNQLFCAVANDCIVPTDQLVNKSRYYFLRQSEHIDRENALIYPLLQRYMTTDDWNRISAEMQSIEDPLFGPAVQEDYKNLYHQILASEDGWVNDSHYSDGSGKVRIIVNQKQRAFC